jgi:acetyltransferase-like isoleucine patch superfamily enzyme
VYPEAHLVFALTSSRGSRDPVQQALTVAIRYASNHIINHIPSYTLRHTWYQRVLGWYIGPKTAIMMGQHVYFVNRVRNGRRVSIGSDTVISRECTLSTTGGLVIGDHVYISPGVWLITGGHDINDPRFATTYQPIIIDDYCWIGPRATILGRVTIGRGAIVQAGAVVTQDVAPNRVVSGVPAKVVGMRDLQKPSYSLNYRPLLE